MSWLLQILVWDVYKVHRRECELWFSDGRSHPPDKQVIIGGRPSRFSNSQSSTFNVSLYERQLTRKRIGYTDSQSILSPVEST